MSEFDLGKILHVINGEAICYPEIPFKGRGSIVIAGERKIGKLGDPFGQVDRPHQAIILFKNIGHDTVVGEKAYAIRKKKKRRRRRY